MPKSKEFLTSSSSGSESEDEEPKSKKKKVEKKPEKKSPKKSEAKPSSSMTGENGETMYQLAKMRYVSVSEFRGKKYVNIREYYNDASGDLKPGRKGIALNEEQWKNLKRHIDDIDNDL
jgi:hypothetical protein